MSQHTPQRALSPDAQEVAEEFKEYAYIVSHDLSAPVRAMVEFSKLLSSEHASQLDEEGKEFLSIIVENGSKLQAMMGSLLDYSRLNTTINPHGSVDCNVLFDRALRALESSVNAAGAKIEVTTLPTLQGDGDQIARLFEVLLDNAIKFQPAGNTPQIAVSARKESNLWHFTVSDNGIGIEQRFIDRIFKLFRRLHSDDEYAGQGAGLALAQKIVHLHGGQIWCESAPGKGSTFHFTIAANV